MKVQRNLVDPKALQVALDSIKGRLPTALNEFRPVTGLILGTGMGTLADDIQSPVVLPYDSIPGFAKSTVSGHAGELILGTLGVTPVVAMNGRCHYYEGFSTTEICFPVQVMNGLGAQSMIVGNASGGLNPKFRSGEVMLIESHLDLMFRGNNSGVIEFSHEGLLRPGKRSVYDNDQCSLFRRLARRHQLVLHQGVYAALSGPNFETRSEYRMLRKLGADVVGMSTIPEANTAFQLGMKVVGLSTITNVADPDALDKTTHEEVMEAVQAAEQTLKTLLLQVLSEPGNEYQSP